MFDFSIFSQPESWIALLTLSFLEIVLGVDNIIFISIVSNKLPAEQQGKARQLGLTIALLLRLAMLFGISWIIGFKQVLFTIDLLGLNHPITGRDLILLGGGLFLLAKSTKEIHSKMEENTHAQVQSKAAKAFGAVLFQIVLLDLVFSFDSILTAVGLTKHIILMVIAVILSMIVMMVFAKRIADFIHKHPTLEILALAFLILIGAMLVAESMGQHVNKGYIYFAVAFSLCIEIINMRMRKKFKKAS